MGCDCIDTCYDQCFVLVGYLPGFMGVNKKFMDFCKDYDHCEKIRELRSEELATVLTIADDEVFDSFFPNSCTEVIMNNIGTLKIETIEEFDKKIETLVERGDYETEIAESGEVLIKTGIYKWKDGYLYSEPEKEELGPEKILETLNSEMKKIVLEAHRRYCEFRGIRSAIEVGSQKNYEGIEFYCVGHNSSHIFYIGVKDGHYYRLSFDTGWEEKYSDGKEYSMKKIENGKNGNLGYVGHY
jgi:hypothetical protein